MTGLARTFSATSDTIARASSGVPAFTSSSKYLPCRTSPTPPYPSECRASTIVRPCGSNTDGLRVTKTLAFIKDSLENLIHVAKLLVEIEGLLDFPGRQHARDVLVGQQQRLEVGAIVERLHRIALHPLIR